MNCYKIFAYLANIIKTSNIDNGSGQIKPMKSFAHTCTANKLKKCFFNLVKYKVNMTIDSLILFSIHFSLSCANNIDIPRIYYFTQLGIVYISFVELV